jgi:hypothetical protein
VGAPAHGRLDVPEIVREVRDEAVSEGAKNALRAQRDRERQEALEAGPGQYVVGVDVSEGQSNTISEGDFHAVHVIDHVRKLQVAEHVSARRSTSCRCGWC